ncbi:hypothetical protein [Nonomuraea sp. NPDC046570]|uniref:hypothetical protein n=1 Tax=Nonomuraea sp. NPDC046570 TaxID=3155255 RepID=UPI0033D3DC73
MLLGDLAELQLELIADAVVERGEALEASVQLVRFAPLVMTAEVDDAAAHVELSVIDGTLRWFCTCAEGRAGAFCAHCVATTLARRRLLVQSACRRTDR